MQGSSSLPLPLFVHGRGPRVTPFPEFELYLVFNVRPGRPATAGTQTGITTIPRCLPVVNRSPRNNYFLSIFLGAHVQPMSFVTNVLLPKYTGVSLNRGPPINNCSTGPARLGGDVLADHISTTGLRILASPFSIYILYMSKMGERLVRAVESSLLRILCLSPLESERNQTIPTGSTSMVQPRGKTS